MPVKVTFSPEEELIVIKYSGTATSNDLQGATEQADQYIKSCNCKRVLVDVRGIESKVSPVKIYNMPKLYDTLGVPRNVFIAMVKSKNAAAPDDLFFYETVCRNRGFIVEIFDDMESAKTWLKGRNQVTEPTRT